MLCLFALFLLIRFIFEHEKMFSLHIRQKVIAISALPVGQPKQHFDTRLIRFAVGKF